MPWNPGQTVFLSTLSLRRATGAPVDRMPSSSISIHALLAESDDVYKEANFPGFAFLSTLSLRRATSALYWFSIADRYFYPRSPCGERPICQALIPPCNAFLSTLSLRRATLRRSASIWLDRYFYPRSPCGERLIMEATKIENKYFYPRSPCGERRSIIRRYSFRR